MIKTTSLELAKKMKELGFPQESFLAWVTRTYEPGLVGENPSTELILAQNINKHMYHRVNDEWVAAGPTAEEVLEQLPTRPKDNSHMELVIWKGSEWTGWNIAYKQMYHHCGKKDKLGHQHDTQDDDNNNLAELAGRLWVYLKEQKLI